MFNTPEALEKFYGILNGQLKSIIDKEVPEGEEREKALAELAKEIEQQKIQVNLMKDKVTDDH